MARSMVPNEFPGSALPLPDKADHVLLVIADDDLCLWFRQDVVHAGARPIIVSSVAEARARMANESTICLLIATASRLGDAKALFREARAKNIPYAIAHICEQGVRLSHMNGNMFEGAPSAMGDYLFRLVQSSLPR